MRPQLRHRGLRAAGIVLVILGFITFWVLRPVSQTDLSTPGFTPLRDDRLATLHAPALLGHTVYGAPTRLLYRMAKNAAGEIFIAFHPFYPHEENPHAGFGAFMSRVIYTGGLHLKDLMFGPADIELIEVVLDKNGRPQSLWYEDAKNYNPKRFGVEHLPVTVKHPTAPFCFEITTWNHMVALRDKEKCKNTPPLTVEYFSETEWNGYKMIKKTEAILRRNRMHRVYEKLAAP